MSPQLAEAQQPPAIVQQAEAPKAPEYFFQARPLPSSGPANFRSEFVEGQINGQPTKKDAHANPHSVEGRPLETDPEIKQTLVGGLGEYRGQHITTEIVGRDPITGRMSVTPLSVEELRLQKIAIDAKLSGEFTPAETEKLATLSKTAEQLVGLTAQTKILEWMLGKKDFQDPASLRELSNLGAVFAATAKQPFSEPLKAELVTVSDKFSRTYQRGVLCRSQGKAPDEEFSRLFTEALNELGQVREKAAHELHGNMEKVKDIAGEAAARNKPVNPAVDEEAPATKHINRMMIASVANSSLPMQSGEQIYTNHLVARELANSGHSVLQRDKN